MRRRLATVVVTLSVLYASPSLAGVLPKGPHVIFSDATITATARHGDAAVTLRMANASAHPVTLLSITEPGNPSAMLFRATNLVTSSAPMTYAASFTVPAHQTLRLGLQQRGAMIANSNAATTVGHQLTLVVHWAAASGVDYTSLVSFTVVKRPPHLHFVMN